MRRLRLKMRCRIQRGIRWFWSQKGSPGERARGLAVGVFCGCFPFFGLQMMLSVGLASLVRGNRLLAAAGTLVSNPLTYVPLYWFNYTLGCWVLGPASGTTGLEGVNRSNLWNQGWDFSQRILLGSALVGALLALLLGLLAFTLYGRNSTPVSWSRSGRYRSRRPSSGSDPSCG